MSKGGREEQHQLRAVFQWPGHRVEERLPDVEMSGRVYGIHYV